MILTVLGTTMAGSASEGCKEMIEYYTTMGGKNEATVFVDGRKMPAPNAAFVNSVMARSLDFCDAMAPGMHIGSSLVPSAFAAAELAGGCSGKQFLAALTIGAELSSRLNLTESAYDGFDPTGVCTVFAATAAVGRILDLDSDQMWNALALAFNRSGGSFQSNIDGSLAVRIIQGWVSQNSFTCAQFAQSGITGPRNFLEGIYGYFHLFGRDRVDSEHVTGDLGKRFELQNMVFKKYPSCGVTQGSTDAILQLIKEEGLKAGDIREINVRVPPYAYKLVGHPFKLGETPRVNAQFSIQYCVASALLRGNSRLHDFDEAAIRDPDVLSLMKQIKVSSDAQLDSRGHTALDMEVLTENGDSYLKKVDISPGFPGNPLTQEEHLEHYWKCLAYMPQRLSKKDAEKIPELIDRMEELEDVRTLIPF
jgi:2-methylcitrate dehydratase PrpD